MNRDQQHCSIVIDNVTYIHGPAVPVWLQEVGRYHKFLDLELALPCTAKAASELFMRSPGERSREKTRASFGMIERPYNAYYNAFLVHMYELMQEGWMWDYSNDDDIFDTAYWRNIERWLRNDDEFNRQLGLAELAYHD